MIKVSYDIQSHGHVQRNTGTKPEGALTSATIVFYDSTHISSSLLTADQLPTCPYFFPTRDMTDQSGCTRFWARFEHALQAYQTTTGVILAEHPLAVQLQSCRSIDSMTTILQYEARAFSDLPESDRMMKAIQSIVSILCAISVTTSLRDATGLVRDEALIACFYIPDMMFRHSHLRKQYLRASLSYLLYVPFLSSYLGILETSVNQASQGVISSFDALVELVDSIERFLSRLDVYTQITPTPSINEIVVKIMVELLSTLVLVTKELKQGRSSESFLADLTSC